MKLTLSCSRCRISKLKCDRKEPCTECIKRDVGHLCVKDERLPRRKRVRVDEDDGQEIEEDYTERSMNELEDYIFDHENNVSSSNGKGSHWQTTTKKPFNIVKPDVQNPFWQAMAHDSKRQKECLELIEEIANALPSSELIKALTEVFVTRCQAPIGNIFHTPSHILQIERLCVCADSKEMEEKKYALFELFSMDMLACLLLSLKLGLAFHPSPKISGWFASQEALQVEQIRCSDQYNRGKDWGTLAQRCIKGGLVPFTGSIASLQVCIMILLDGGEDRANLENILVCAISGARRLGLHNLGKAELKPKEGERLASLIMPSHIRTEVGVRIWWALSIHDWAHAQITGQFTIHPSQVSTRKPLHINDQDLSTETSTLDDQGFIVEQPKTQFTMLSYTIHTIQIANLLRQILQAKIISASSRVQYGKMYESLVADLPPYFRFGSTIGTGTTIGPAQAIPVHRWMIHQQLWSLLLRFHRNRLAASIQLQYSQMLALNIIGTQVQMQSSCVVCGSLSTSPNQILHAAAVLLFDLLRRNCLKNKENNSDDQLFRMMIRDKVREAIELLKLYNDHTGDIHQSRKEEQKSQVILRGINLLEALIQLEEAEANKIAEQSTNESRISLKELREKIASIINSLQEHNEPNLTHFPNSSATIGAGKKMSSDIRPTMSAAELLMDLKVLPITADDQISLNFQDFDVDPLVGSFTSQSDRSEESFELGEFLEMMMTNSNSSIDTINAAALNTPNSASANQLDHDKAVSTSSISPSRSVKQIYTAEYNHFTGPPTPSLSVSSRSYLAARMAYNDSF